MMQKAENTQDQTLKGKNDDRQDIEDHRDAIDQQGCRNIASTKAAHN